MFLLLSSESPTVTSTSWNQQNPLLRHPEVSSWKSIQILISPHTPAKKQPLTPPSPWLLQQPSGSYCESIQGPLQSYPLKSLRPRPVAAGFRERRKGSSMTSLYFSLVALHTHKIPAPQRLWTLKHFFKHHTHKKGYKVSKKERESYHFLYNIKNIVEKKMFRVFTKLATWSLLLLRDRHKGWCYSNHLMILETRPWGNWRKQSAGTHLAPVCSRS